MNGDRGDAAEYRIRWRDEGSTGEREVLASVDRRSGTTMVTLPNGVRFTVDVVCARAVGMLLWQSVFGALRPDGPFLRLEAGVDGDWTDLRELR